jgi:SOS-response transcriptional repressor LexA
MLTTKQHELLAFIDKHLRETGCSPSFEEMKDALDLKSKSGIHRLISALEERGFLRRHKHRARALEVIRLSEDLSALQRPAGAMPQREAQRFAPNVIRGDFSGKLPGVRAANIAGAVQLPLYGKIAAGLPIEALNGNTEEIEDGSDAEEITPPRQLDRPRAGERPLRNEDLPGRARQRPRPPDRAVAKVLVWSSPAKAGNPRLAFTSPLAPPDSSSAALVHWAFHRVCVPAWPDARRAPSAPFAVRTSRCAVRRALARQGPVRSSG